MENEVVKDYVESLVNNAKQKDVNDLMSVSINDTLETYFIFAAVKVYENFDEEINFFKTYLTETGKFNCLEANVRNGRVTYTFVKDVVDMEAEIKLLRRQEGLNELLK